MCPMNIIAVCAIIFMVLFIFWQFKMLKKYALKYDKFKINLKQEYLSVNGQEINFKEIDHITVRELEQPSALEKTLSKSAFYAYMAEIVFHLKNGPNIYCTFNYKGTLYRTLKQLEPYVKIDEDIDYYKPKIRWFNMLMVIAAVIIVLSMNGDKLTGLQEFAIIVFTVIIVLLIAKFAK